MSEAKMLSQSTKFSGKWLVFKTVSFEISGKIIKDYEYIDRPEGQKHNTTDGVSIAPIIVSAQSKSKKIVIVANFRPAINNFNLEFPGGIVETDSVESDAFRELKEETGYTGKRIISDRKAPSCHYDAWKSKENGRLLIIEIDGDDEINKKPEQKLDETEVIKVIVLDFDKDLVKRIEEISETHKFGISDQLYSFALGLSLSSMFEESR